MLLVIADRDSWHAGNVLQYTQLASVLMGAGQFGEAEALLNQLLLHVETVKVRALLMLLDVAQES